MKINVEIVGTDRVVARVTKMASESKRKVRAKQYTQAQRTLTKAQRYCPVDTGALRASGSVWMEGDYIVIGFGGPAAPYAPYVHEILHYKHPNGQAKYLERAVSEDAHLFALAAAEGLKQ